MIKLQDFAKECGVTDRQIQRQLKKYAAELEGLYERQGSNGTWLTDDACAILRSKMRKAPVTMYQGGPDDKALADKDAEIKELRDKLDRKEVLLESAYRRVDALQEKVVKVAALEEGKLLLEGRLAEKDAAIAQKDAAIERAEATIAEVKASEARLQQEHAAAVDRAERAEATEAMLRQELVDAAADKEQAVAAARRDAEQDIEEKFKSMSIWEFLKTKRKK